MRDDKLEVMQEGGQILSKILQELKLKTIPGTKTKEINDWANRLCLKYKVKPSFLNYNGFPASICVSLNDEIVHGLPGEKQISEGDIVSLDFGVFCKGYHTDSAITFGVGPISETTEKLLRVTEEALYVGINQAVIGARVGCIGHAIQEFVEKQGYGVVRVLVGHGIGKEVHEDPMIPNFGNKNEGQILKRGQTIAIEPMVTAGDFEVFQSADGWTYQTKDQSLSAHFEHTVYLSENGAIILTK